jgi:V8-like Glu-specific endopeptidase
MIVLTSPAIVKLQLRYEKQEADDERWAMGTGWLIRPDLLVTAGHCVYDWRDSLGKVVQVKAYIGYSGKGSIGSPDVQFRRGHRIAATEGWLKGPENRTNDVSFIQVEKPFTGIVPFKFAETPLQGNDMLGVVGYPADMKLNDKKDGEKGAQMYEEFEMVKYDIGTSPKHMLEYRVSTYAGTYIAWNPRMNADRMLAIAQG